MRWIGGCLVAAATILIASCDGNTTRAIKIGRLSEAEARRVLPEFIAAVVARDTAQLRTLATDSVLEQVRRELLSPRLARDYESLSQATHINSVEVVLGGADVSFRYLLDREERNARASVR